MQSLDPGIMMPESGRALEHAEAVELSQASGLKTYKIGFKFVLTTIPN